MAGNWRRRGCRPRSRPLPRWSCCRPPRQYSNTGAAPFGPRVAFTLFHKSRRFRHPSAPALLDIIPAARQPLVCLALLLLATLCSPFLPQGYAGFPPIWLLTLLAAIHPPNGRTLAWLVAGWLCFNLYWPTDLGLSARALALMTLVPQALAAWLAIRVLWAIPAGVADAEPAPAVPAGLAAAEGTAG